VLDRPGTDVMIKKIPPKIGEKIGSIFNNISQKYEIIAKNIIGNSEQEFSTCVCGLNRAQK
jgi:hypothetical protein